jgi:hypothetical protein
MEFLNILKCLIKADQKKINTKFIEIDENKDRVQFSIFEGQKGIASLSITKKELRDLAKGVNEFLGEDLIKFK